MSIKILYAYLQTRSLFDDVSDRSKKRLSEDSGEMGSYLILAAGLVVAAVAVVGILGGLRGPCWLVQG